MTMTPTPTPPTLGEREPEPWQGQVEELRGLVSDRAMTGETLLLNLGPHHPSTHGVLRLLLELDGEEIVSCIPDVGYLHTGIENFDCIRQIIDPAQKIRGKATDFEFRVTNDGPQIIEIRFESIESCCLEGIS